MAAALARVAGNKRTAPRLSRGWRRAALLLSVGVSPGCGSDEQRARGGGGSDGASPSGGAGGSSGALACTTPSESFAWPEAETPAVAAHDSWKPAVELPTDRFFSSPQGGSSEDRIVWIKFIVLTSDPERIYFQDSARAPFHYDFASQQVPAFRGMTRAEFDAVSLESEGRQAVLGALVMPLGRAASPEYGVQIVSNDDVHPALVERVMHTRSLRTSRRLPARRPSI